MAGSLDSRRVREWQRRMARFREARQSVAEFCRQKGVSAPSFYQWRKRLAQRPRPTEKATSFLPVQVVGSVGVVVQLPGGMQLHVPISDRRALRLAITTLARIDARHAGGNPC